MFFKNVVAYRQFKRIKHWFPFLYWFPELKKKSVLKADIVAGFTVAMLIIPQAMAYAHLAGLPAYMGLYAAFLPPIIGALFGSSRILSTGPVPVAALLTAVAIQSLVPIGTDDYLHYVVLLAFLSGFIQLMLGLLRFGIVVNFISYPVILGFINAVALIIAAMQLGNLLGIYAVPAPHVYQMVWQVVTDAVDNIHWPTLGVATFAFIIIVVGRKWRPHWPHTLIAVIVTSILAWLTGYEQSQVISTEQIINLPVQELLIQDEQYPKEMQAALLAVEKTKKNMRETLQKAGENTKKTDEAIQQAEQAQWQLDRLIAKQNFITKEISRLRFYSLLTQEGREVFFVPEQMTPLGQVGTKEWRIIEGPTKGKLTLQAGGAIIGYVPAGLPTFQSPPFSWSMISKLFMAALVIALMGFTEAATIAKRVATENRQRLDINQELLGQGLAKCVGSFFQSMPVSGGFSRTAVNFYAGAKTGFSSIVTGLVVMMVLLWFTSLFYYLPYATLAVVVMVGVLGLLNLQEMVRVWRISRKEGFVSLVTFLLTLLLAPHVAYAVALGMVLSLSFYLYETMRPKLYELVRDSDGNWKELDEEMSKYSCPLISFIRFNGALYFANAAYFENYVSALVAKKRKLRYLILDCSHINHLDATGLDSIRYLYQYLAEMGVDLWFTRVRKGVLAALDRGGLIAHLGEGCFSLNNYQVLNTLAEHVSNKHKSTCPLWGNLPKACE